VIEGNGFTVLIEVNELIASTGFMLTVSSNETAGVEICLVRVAGSDASINIVASLGAPVDLPTVRQVFSVANK